MIESTENIYLAEAMPDQEQALNLCMKLVYKTAHRYKGGRLAFEDLVSVASSAVLESLKTYDPAKGCSFQSYAMFRIRKAVFSHMENFANPFSVSWRDAANDCEFISPDALSDLKASESFAPDFSLSEAEDISFLQTCMNRLETRERLILNRRFGMDGKAPASCACIGEQVGLSGEAVRKIEMRSIERLREELLPEYI